MPKFPFTNYHELNLDWILKKVEALFTASEENARTIRTYDTRLTRAEQTATNAETAATSAQQLADAAAANADNALSVAGTADAKADSALTASTDARRAAAGALTVAQEAQQTANNAAATASNATAIVEDYIFESSSEISALRDRIIELETENNINILPSIVSSFSSLLTQNMFNFTTQDIYIGTGTNRRIIKAVRNKFIVKPIEPLSGTTFSSYKIYSNGTAKFLGNTLNNVIIQNLLTDSDFTVFNIPEGLKLMARVSYYGSMIPNDIAESRASSALLFFTKSSDGTVTGYQRGGWAIQTTKRVLEYVIDFDTELPDYRTNENIAVALQTRNSLEDGEIQVNFYLDVK